MSIRPVTLAVITPLIALFIIGCKKGDTGPAGPQGPQGKPGVVGPAGANGTIIYSGTTTPAPSLGDVGDYYLDLSTDVLYGPKGASGWGTGFPMKGDTGATGQTGPAGTPGTKIYAGTGAPDSTLGVVGDYYVDTVAHTFYGPKLGAGWGLPIMLQGAAGPAGPAGTANVQYTPWFAPVNSWHFWIETGDIYTWFTDQKVPALTIDIMESGTILVYGQLVGYNTSIVPSGGAVAQLPIFLGTTDVWEAFATNTNIQIKYTNSNNSFDIYSPFPYRNSSFRVVIIPGGVSVPLNIPYGQLKNYLHVNFSD